MRRSTTKGSRHDDSPEPRRRPLLPTAALVLTATVCGCEDRAETWSTPLQISGPHAAANQALWLDGTRGLAFALEPDPPTRVRVVPLRRGVIGTRTDVQKEKLYVLTAGKERELRKQTAEAPALSVVTPRAGQSPEVTVYELPTAFERIVLSDDGRTALLHQASDTAGATATAANDPVFRNPNQIAIIELEAPQGTGNPTLRTLRSFGAAPLGAVITPPLSIPERDARRLAVVLSQNYLTLFDLDHLDRREITVRLAPDSGVSATTNVVPRQVLVAPDEGLIFVRADNAEDIFALALLPTEVEDDDDDANDFRPTISQPSAGRVVRDMLLVGGDSPRVLTANASGDLALITVDTGELTVHEVGGPIDTLVGVPAEDPTLVLAFSRGEVGSRVDLIDIPALIAGEGNAIVSRSVGQPLRDVVVTPDNRRALLIHDAARTVVSLIDLVGEHHTVTPIEGAFPLQTFDFAGGNQLVGANRQRQRLGFLSLDDLTSSDVRLDYAPGMVLSLGDHVAVDHAATQGLVTLMPAPPVDVEEKAQVLWGFLLEDLLERELRD